MLESPPIPLEDSVESSINATNGLFDGESSKNGPRKGKQPESQVKARQAG